MWCYYRFYRQFFQFLLYFLLSLICFTLRPGPPPSDGVQATTEIPKLTQVTFVEKNLDKFTGNNETLVRRNKRYSTNTTNQQDSQQFSTTVEWLDQESTSTDEEVVTISTLTDQSENFETTEIVTTLEISSNDVSNFLHTVAPKSRIMMTRLF